MVSPRSPRGGSLRISAAGSEGLSTGTDGASLAQAAEACADAAAEALTPPKAFFRRGRLIFSLLWYIFSKH